MTKLNITIIGFGNVGSTLAFLLLEHSFPLRLNIMQPSSNKDGSLLDMRHTMAQHADKEFHVNDNELFKEANFIFYAAGAQNVHGQSRLTTAEKNKQMTREIFCDLKFSNDPYIIVISNPVDLITHTLQSVCKVNPHKVLGTGTFLDSMRLSFYLSELSGIPPSKFEAWVLGEHGDSQIPVYSMTKVDGTKIVNDTAFSRELLKEAGELTRNAAFQIRETQNGTMYGIAKCSVKIMDYLLDETERIIPLSVQLNDYYKNLLGIDKHITMSIPVKISSEGVEIINTSLTDDEIVALRNSALLLQNYFN